ncbi:signal peptidase I [Deinococcus metallilatus]|uniref:Signal peptidase I n=1 Tax=Deinococcus metallilatus TaxID=1211322 RepID=A0AAJ5F7U1_9DEIO|nr:signal peptidase I [Deinococcus metallilatus]MBB5294791.1 signal peptidase I [Deinococcus metallilatus]QBY09487.1 signal peptidase I [Deinococcus metallilatus]RXJ09492.1 signal peptidase I [Deinococcus metallilatus]TLK29014.1 signal peptidase I [Deinococcus metallilatus]GMA16717.1 signal peptidase I [Deinococcus metallilatus]
MKTRLRQLWREWGSPVVFALLVTQFGATAVKVDGASMMPALRNGEWLAVPKVEGWAHRAGLGTYQRGDVVVFKPPRAAASEWTHDYRGFPLPWAYRPYLVKRVVALPGDRVRMNRGELYVNGRRVDQDWTLPFWQGLCLDRNSVLANSVASSPVQMEQAEITVPAEHYFVLGDNRSPGGSLDSRVFGPVGVGDIAGRALASVWPLAVPGQATPPCDGQAHPERRVTFGGKTRWNPRMLTPPAGLNELP